jgi:hypothetical protein
VQVGNRCPGTNIVHRFDSGFCLNQCPRPCVPHPVLIHIRNKQRVDKHAGEYVSVTSLTPSVCPRQFKLERTMDYYVEPPLNWYSIRGTLLHLIMQNPDFAALVDDMRNYVKRLFDRGEMNREDLNDRWIEAKWMGLEAELLDLARNMPKIHHIDDWESEIEYEFPLGIINGKPRKVRGTIDVLRKQLGHIKDYKTIGDKGLGVIKKGAKEDHIWQFNMYRLLAERGFPVGMSYETYHAPVIKHIEAYYLTMMECVGTGSNHVEVSDWRVSDLDLMANQSAEQVGLKIQPKLKRGKKFATADLIHDYELQTYKKFRVTSAIPDVPLLDLDTVEKYMREQAIKRFHAFDNAGYMPDMCDEDTREWKCDKFCPKEIREACDAHNEIAGTPRITERQKQKNEPKEIEFQMETTA